MSMYRLKSEEDAAALLAKLRAARNGAPARSSNAHVAVQPSLAIQADSPPKSKYFNTRTQRHGLKFDSKLEADWFDHLRFLCRGGEVLWFTRQVPFNLPGGIRFYADYVVMYRAGVMPDGLTPLVRPEVQDCKAKRKKTGEILETRVSINKRRQMKAIYGIDVRIITKDDLQVRSI